MGNGFTNVRLPYAEQWQDECIERMKSDGWEVVPMGAENVAPSVQQALSMMANPDATARFVRYMPDGFAVKVEEETAIFFDAKRGKSIEKDAYIAYLAFAGDNRNVYIMIKSENGAVYRVPVKGLKFLCSREYVAKFTEYNRIPVDDDGWIAPRLWPEDRYREWKRRYQTASGTPFKYFDFKQMEMYREK